MLQVFSTREIASFIWIIALVSLCIVSKKARGFLCAIIEYSIRPKMLFPVLIFLSITALIVYLFSLSALWKWKFVKDISFWFIFLGLGMTKSTLNFDIKNHYLKTILLDNIKVTVLIEFLVSSFTFNLIAELVIFPILAFILLITSSSSGNPQYASLNKTFTVLQVIIGMLIFYFSLKVAVSEYQTENSVDMLISFLLPIAFTVLFIPITFFITLKTEYKLLFGRIKFLEPDEIDLRRWHRKLILNACGFSLIKVSIFKKYFAVKMLKTMTKDEFSNLISEFQSSYKERLVNCQL